MEDLLTQLGRQAAQQALLELAGRSFGAVQSVNLTGVEQREEAGESYALLSWHVESLGVGQEIRMVILPEFLEANPEIWAEAEDMPAWLTAQMAGYIVECVQTSQQEPDES